MLLDHFERSDSELSILFTDDKTIREYNKKYLSRDYPTDVIAFPMNEGDFSNLNSNIMGDILISVETAEQNAKRAKVSVEHEIYHLLIHGILHLLGFDHEKDRKSALMMRKYERFFLTKSISNSNGLSL